MTRPFRAQDEPAVLEVLRIAFGHWPLDIEGVDAADFFRWKHHENPFGPSILSVAEAGGAVVGFGAGMQWQVRVGDRVLKAIRGVDVAVHPDYRGRSLAVALIQETEKRFPADLAVGFTAPNEMGLSGIRRAGRRRAGDLLMFARPSRPLRSAVRLALRGSTGPEDLPIEAETATEALADPEQVSQLLEQGPPPRQVVTTARDLEYLRWRYAQLTAYRAVRVESDGRLSGLAIFRLRHHGSVSVARVCDLLVANGDAGLRRRLLRGVRRATGTDFISCSFASRLEAGRYGFLPASRGRVLMVNPLRPDLLPDDPTRRESWALSTGDLEII